MRISRCTSTKLITAFLLMVGSFLVSGSHTSVHAATLLFDPTSASAAVGSPIELGIVVNAGSDEILAVDAQIRYDKNTLEVETCVDGTFLKVARKDFGTPGQIYIAGIVEDPGSPVTGKGTMATCTFKVKGNATTNVMYACTPGETASDSNVAKNNADATDVIQCPDNGVAVITAGTGLGGAPTATPSGTIGGTGDLPTQLPKTGIIDELMKFAVPGAILVAIGLVSKVLLKL